jgi:hypothetical protein
MKPDKVEIPDSVQYVRVEGDFVLMDLRAGLYFGLDPVASHIWQSLSEHGEPQRAAEELCEDYDVEPEQALADVERWIMELEGKGLLVRAGGQPPARKT